MNEFVKSQEIMRNLSSQVLGGAKIPHSCSFPVLRMEDGKLMLALFVQLQKREYVAKGLMERPAYWYLADLQTGALIDERKCREKDFCTAPFDKLYLKGQPEKPGTRADAEKLYQLLDELRVCYIETNAVNAFIYKEYLNLLYKVTAKNQINFYKELSKLK